MVDTHVGEGRPHSRTDAGARPGRVAVALLAVVAALALPSAAAAAPGPGAGGPGTFDPAARAADARAAIDARDDVTAAASPRPFELGDCGEAGVGDVDEGLDLDIEFAAVLADCEGLLSAGVLTHDAWPDAELDSFIAGLDTDRNPATGCSGFEYTVVVLHDAGTFPGVVFQETPGCGDAPVVGDAVGARIDDPTFIAMYWEHAAIGSPSSFAFTIATRSIYTSQFDFAPEPGTVQPVLALTGGPTPPPAPVARPIDPACTFDGGFEDGFVDVPDTNPHERAIDCIVYWHVAAGTGPGTYGPAAGVTRGQMATFLARFVERSGGAVPSNPPDAFGDDEGSPHEANIDKLAAAGIAGGRTDGTFGAAAPVTRAQMATFVIRTLQHRLGGPVGDGQPVPDHFTDDDGNPHETNIDAAADLGIAGGTGGNRFDPQATVRRDQMGSFLARGLAELVDRGVAAIPRCRFELADHPQPEELAPCLYGYWRAGDQAVPDQVASPAAVAQIFERPWEAPDAALTGCVQQETAHGEVVCTFDGYGPEDVSIEMYLGGHPDTNAWTVLAVGFAGNPPGAPPAA